MDAEAAALLTTAGTTVVALMATDAWKQTRDGLVRLWHRFRPEHAEAIGRELTAGRAVVASALARGDTQPETPLGRLWAQELRELLADPHAARELRVLLLACKQAAPGNDGAPSRSQRTEARAEGHARSYAGHDMTIIEGASGDQVVYGGLHIHQAARDRDSGIENAVILTVDYRRVGPPVVVDTPVPAVVPVGGYCVITIEAEPDRAVVLHAMRPVVVARRPPRPACFGVPEFLVGDTVPPRLFSVDLDAAPPMIEPAGPTDFPYKVSRTDVEQFRVKAKPPVAEEILWHLELEWSCAGHRGKTVVDDNGEPFVSYPRLKRGSAPDLGCRQWHLRGCPAERLAEMSECGRFRTTARGPRIRPDNGGADLLLFRRDVQSGDYPRYGDRVTYRAQYVSNGIRAFSVRLEP